MRPHRTLLIVACVALAGAQRADARQAQDGERPPRRVTAAPTEFPTPFSVVRAVMALPDGRLVLSDPQENKLYLLDYAKGSSQQLARIGQGPQEYRVLGGLYRAKSGGVLVFDQGQRRLLPISAKGEPQDVIALPIPGSSSSGGNRAPDPYASDSLGNAVGALRGARFAASQEPQPLIRYHRTMKADTVARLLRRGSKLIESTSNSFMSMDITYSPQDAWLMAPDGAVAIVRAAPYHVEWIPLSGSTLSGPPITYTPIKVTKADRDEFIAGLSDVNGKINISMGGGRSGSNGAPAGTGSPTRSEPIFADVKASFDATFGHWPIIDEQGRVWICRFQAVGRRNQLFDVVDRRGVLVDRVELPPGSRLVGFDSAWLYAVRVDDNDLEHLQRFPLSSIKAN